MKSNLKIILVLLIIGEIFSVRMMYKSYNNETIKENVEEIPKKQFAIKVDNGSGKYEDSTGFPGIGYSLNISLTKCEDQMGNKVSNVKIESNGTNVTVTSKYTVYCTLYFEKIRNLTQLCSGIDIKTCINNKKDYLGNVANITTSLVGGMYRYQGTNDVNNYICFGTTNQSTCTSNADKYMYRIIGVTDDGQLALIKETGVKEIESTNRVFFWNNKYSKTNCESDGSLCTWANSKLYNRINGLCKSDNPNCSGTISGSDGDSNIFIGNSYYEYLTNGSVWLDKIIEHEWKYGESKELNSYNGDTAYSIESQFPNSIKNAKIGLQYMHDYYYAYPGGNPENKDNAKNAWIHLSKDGISEISYEWLISKYGVSSTYVMAWNVGSNGRVFNSYLGASDGVRPVFYLISDTKIKSGTGEKTNPYIIDI